MAPSITVEDGEHVSSVKVQNNNLASQHLNGQNTSDVTYSSVYKAKFGEANRDAIDMNQVRSHFPVLSGETVLFNNASGTVVLGDAVTMCVLNWLLKVCMALIYNTEQVNE